MTRWKMNKKLSLLLLLAMFSSMLSAQPVYIPQDLRDAPEYVLPGSRYGILHGATIPHFLSTEGDHRDFLRVLISNRHEIDVLSLESEYWDAIFEPDELPQGWRFTSAGRIRCPTAVCLLLGIAPTYWIVTADNEYRVLDIALITERKTVFDKGRGRQREFAIMDSVFGWDGDRVTQPSHFSDTGIFCTDYLRNATYGAQGFPGSARSFMRQVLPDGRILSRELTTWTDCVESDPIEPLGSAAQND